MTTYSSLRRLEQILRQAVEDPDSRVSMLVMIAKVMDLDLNCNYELIDFFQLLRNAEKDIRRLSKYSSIKNYDDMLQDIYDIQSLFMKNHWWNTQWGIIANAIKSQRFLSLLNTHANLFESFENKNKELSNDAIEYFHLKFVEILDEIKETEISESIKLFLIDKINEIINSLKKISIEGLNGLQKTNEAIVGRLCIQEKSFSEEDRNKPTYLKFRTLVTFLSVMLTPGVYDVVSVLGAIPTWENYYQPKIEKLLEQSNRDSNSQSKIKDIQEVIKDTCILFEDNEQKQFSGL